MAAGLRSQGLASFQLPVLAILPLHWPSHNKAAFFFRASKRISLLLFDIFFFYLIKSHPPRIISLLINLRVNY